MSAMPARIAELPDTPAPMPARVQRRSERRAALKEARRDRQRWTIISCCVLGSSFILTVGILDVLH